MSYNTFPTFAGLAWDIKKRILFSTDIETAASGAEYRTGYFATPLYEFDLTFNYLSQTDLNTLQGFYIGQQGPLVPFYLSIINDTGSPYLVRFLDDKVEWNQFANAMYEQTGLTLRSVR